MKKTLSEESPFHRGEQAMHLHTNKSSSTEKVGKRAIRPYLIEQHREFFKQLPFIVIGSVDLIGNPWASILSGKPGFAYSPTARALSVSARANIGDPLSEALQLNAPIGVLGIEIPTKRRNRLNARVSAMDENGFALAVDQSFGNCPQYISRRIVDFYREPNTTSASSVMTTFSGLDNAARDMIRAADTFFVASYINAQDQPEIEGVDVSHRGGDPGFVKVDGDTLTIPDYAGNNFFNTLGNFVVNAKAGLIFVDFATGDTLQLTGSVELLLREYQLPVEFTMAKRAWRVTVERSICVTKALPFTARPIET